MFVVMSGPGIRRIGGLDVISINDKRMKAKDDQDGLLPRIMFFWWLWGQVKRALLNGAAESAGLKFS